MVEFWISKTHVRIVDQEMTRDEAASLCRDILAEIAPRREQRWSRWTKEMDGELTSLREAGKRSREIARIMFEDETMVHAVSARIARLGLPVSEAARRSGQAGIAERRRRRQLQRSEIGDQRSQPTAATRKLLAMAPFKVGDI